MILLNLPESPLLCMGMNGSPERGGGTEAQVVGFKEAPPFGRGASLVLIICLKSLQVFNREFDVFPKNPFECAGNGVHVIIKRSVG